ncbi:M56 family metallopeptidase [Sphingoaurantiacus capsulatus]|uniref:M56 family metallopeptidase n=1 Tax=Sphingoaurantiacus capsulatus TaxID=1771310 RepID=A0ABV7X950_9SPHN
MTFDLTPDFFIEMAWKSAAISALALAALTLLRSRSATDRAAVVRLAVLLLLALPVISLALPRLQVEQPVAAIETREATPTPTPPPAAEAPVVVPADTIVDVGMPAEPVQVASPAPLPEPKKKLPTGLLLTLGYVLGASLLVLRLLAGLWTLGRWTKAADPVEGPAWTRALQRARRRTGVEMPVRLLVSAHINSPLSWGLRAPAILIDFDTLDREEDADAVLAHEMAHVARRDWLMLMLSRLVVALFWFNPLVWLLERALVQQCEEAADLRALGDVEPVSYARTLVACGAHAQGLLLPANRIAGQGLAKRVRAILDEKVRATPSGSAWTGIAMLVCVIVSAPIAALELVAPKPPAAPVAPRPPVAPAALMAPAAPPAPLAPMAPPAPPAPIEDADEITMAVDAALANAQRDEVEADTARAAADAARAQSAEARALAAEARIEARAARAQATEDRAAATVARAEAARTADVARIEAAATRMALQIAQSATRVAATATAAASAQASASASARASAAARPGPLTADDLIEMKIQGVDVRYLAELAELAPRIRLSAKEIVQTKIHGLTPERLREFADAGYARTPVDELVAMRIHGVTGRYIAELAAAGYTGIDTDDLVAMRIHGVSASAAKRAAAGGKRPTPEELVEMQLRGKL